MSPGPGWRQCDGNSNEGEVRHQMRMLGRELLNSSSLQVLNICQVP